MSTLSVPYWAKQPSDWSGFRVFPRVPTVCKGWNVVRYSREAIEAETARREAEDNSGERYPFWSENLPDRRRLKDD
ncbi:hypothetical protein J2W15_003639 [Pseudarthrobacter sulfonivorans]|nr:hypothetical protein [Pseudarthrobacter sulfonivorans]